MRLHWSDVGHTEEPGEWDVWGARVQIAPKHIEKWKQDPDGIWEAVTQRKGVHQPTRWHPSEDQEGSSDPAI
jgi:hypothetical protein